MIRNLGKQETLCPQTISEGPSRTRTTRLPCDSWSELGKLRHRGLAQRAQVWGALGGLVGGSSPIPATPRHFSFIQQASLSTDYVPDTEFNAKSTKCSQVVLD